MLRSAPWTRAPMLAARYNTTSFVGCLLAGAVLCTAAASGPLFLSSTATAGLHSEAAQNCPESSRPAITNDAGPASFSTAAQAPARLAANDTAVRSALRSRGAPAPYRVSTSVASVRTSSGGWDAAFLFSRTDAAAHVRIIAGGSGHGLLVPASYARKARAGVGSSVRVGPTGRARIVGVYRDLAPSAFVPLFDLPHYWCTWRDEIVPTPFNRPAPMMLTNDDTLIAADSVVDSTWYDPTPIEDRTVAQASRALSRTGSSAAELDPRSFHLVGDLGSDLAKAERIRTGVGGAALPIVVAAVLVSALLVAASGLFWGLRRQRELRLLSSRGVGRVAIGVKAGLEMLPAMVVGGLIGWLAALGVVRALGPSSLFEPGAPLRALGAAALAAAGGIVLLAVAGARTVATDRQARRRSVLRHVPWELVLVAAGIGCYVSIRHNGAVRVVRATVQINPLVTAFPLLALTGAVLLIGRGSALGVGELRRVQPRSLAAYLAARRVARSRAVAFGVLVAVALPVSVFVYAVAVSGSTQRDVDAKYRTNVGAPQALGLLTHGVDARPDGLGAIVTRIDSGATLDGGLDVAVEGIDPSSFARFAFDGSGVAQLLARHQGGDRTSAVLVNASASVHVTTIRIGNREIPVTRVGTQHTVPGLRDPYRPVVVVDRTVLPPVGALVDRTDELWTTTAKVRPALDRLLRQGIEANYVISPTTFLNSSGLRPVTWVFGYLRAVAMLTGAIGLAGLCFAFTARTRQAGRAYHLARRMGLTRREHRRSLTIELGALVVTSWLVGVAFAAAAVASVYRLTDPYPSFPPMPSFPSLAGPVLLTLVVAVMAVLIGAWALQHQSDRSNPATVLRT